MVQNSFGVLVPHLDFTYVEAQGGDGDDLRADGLDGVGAIEPGTDGVDRWL